ncbi:MAG TPA: hypothetical protein VK452_03310 [Dissulfurispiraceae bacterium]|nr:hypothetical protein [Dissulfurispiraceae bacterium]
MTSLKLLKWLAIAIIAPWLLFMIISAFKGGDIFTQVGESMINEVRDISIKLSRKADRIKAEADEWKEKLGFKHEEKAKEVISNEEKAPANKTKKAVKSSSARPSHKSGD